MLIDFVLERPEIFYLFGIYNASEVRVLRIGRVCPFVIATNCTIARINYSKRRK